MISLGDYHYSKSNKAVVRRGKKRIKDQGDVDTSLSNQVVWTQQSGDPQVDVADIASALGSFTGAKFHAIHYLNKEFDKKKEQIIKLKEELEQTKKEHEAHIAYLMKISEDKCNELKEKNNSLQNELLLRPRKSQVTIVGILPNKRSQLACSQVQKIRSMYTNK